MSVDLRPRHQRKKAEINIIPLVDVLVVLIFFFLVSMQFRNMTLLQLTLPEIRTAGQEQLGDQLEVGVSPEGDFYFNGQAVSREELTRRLGQAAAENDDRAVVILADEESSLGSVTFVMDSCRQVGLNRIRLQSR